MAEKVDIEIGEEMRRIVGAGRKRRFPVMSGVVVAVNDDGSCNVQLTSGADNTATEGVLLNVVLSNENGMYLVPAVEADCIVAEIDGPGQLKQLLWASSYTEMRMTVGGSQITVTNGLLQFNDGSLGGLAKILQLVDRYNIIEQDLNTLKMVVEGWTPVANDGGAALKAAAATWYGADLTETVRGDIENTNIKQG